MPKTVRAKFRVSKLDKFDQGTRVEMAPVYSEDPKHENKHFWDATPSGRLDMVIKNEAAAELFEEGKEYYLDFAPA